ncbi:TPA: hypothetical protein DDW69_02700 [candidate division CPR2 bacterium]|uniref:Epoxyqueuosine reductase QueH n=1 Tax=candidate division CPR2 bacterium GW2011_GWC1_41_48 TaxID=1618344 RepID=A0A0G0YI36_UNCC2|nr:MAG: hypothetical protein UT47_C0003G0257 [candidate division CPR2 bacterium GW2011_GWC2_39_35]KKR29270.1 MAG: hypothetical protein UT60_C0004G0007 [candidate division CPR2 bacterium GW2011_GWD2_39_7]KKS09196.1 MAG: hypothetical protein UU65_C0003G0251 [candidate division CPR2 bacterium GW2011_GWC1_41_48]OGB70936.1 MAG: hypothetical protein A2Y26_05585 [candidate division CPR2 bacterium GWD2_39_7]HBG81730.1 hypothetical protein [candidate division CPR2 bacterium]
MKKLLLHTCCGPCLTYPGEVLKKEFEVTAFYFNPNIHPKSEYDLRFLNAIKATEFIGIRILVGDYLPKSYFQAINSNDKTRCFNCYNLRLEETAKKAKELGFKAFSTTLLVSPYQNQELIMKIGDELACCYGVEFISEDFRPGFKEGREAAMKMELYMQNFCGCTYSFAEKYDDRLERG